MKPLILASGALLCTACSSTGPTGGGSPDRVNDSALDSGSSKPDDTEQPSILEASWFGLEGVLLLDEAEPTVALTVHFYADEQTSTPLCSVETETVDLVAHEFTPDSTVSYWANTGALLTLSGEPCPDSARLPRGEIQLGIGTLHSALIPILEAQGLGDIAINPDTSGSYIGFNTTSPTEQDPGTAFVLGYALNETDETSQLSDSPGPISLHGLFLFPLEEFAQDTGGVSNQ